MFYQQSKYYTFKTRNVTSSHTSEADRYRRVFLRKTWKVKHHLDAVGIFLTLYWLVWLQWKICFTDPLCSLELLCCRRNTLVSMLLLRPGLWLVLPLLYQGIARNDFVYLALGIIIHGNSAFVTCWLQIYLVYSDLLFYHPYCLRR